MNEATTTSYERNTFKHSIATVLHWSVNKEHDTKALYYSNEALCLLDLKYFESAFNSIQKAIKTDPGQSKYYRIAGFICIELAKQCKNLDYAKMALDNYCSAQELSGEEKDITNYQMARKFLHKLSQDIKSSEKQDLFAYLKGKGVNLAEIDRFFKKFGDEQKKEIPKVYLCAISMVK